MRKLYLCIAILLLGVSNGFAQNPNNHWQLGVSDLNFNSNPPTVTTVANNGQYGNASISDDNGNLLFYTDGLTIWNKNHQAMQNGGNIGTISSNPNNLPQAQPVIIVPNPGSANQFFVFITANSQLIGESSYPGDSYRCYTVDFSDSLYPLGKVLSGYQILSAQGAQTDFTFRPLTCVKNATNDGYFIIGQFGNKIESYMVTSQGLNLTPIESDLSAYNISYSYADFFDEFQHNTSAVIKFSPDNLKLGELVINRTFHSGPNTSTSYSKFFTLDFNNQTGVFSNFTLVEDNPESYGASLDFDFSSDSQKVYFIHDKVYVRDLSNISTPARDLTDANNITQTGFTNIQRDKYGDILISSKSTTNNMNLYIHSISAQNSFSSSSLQVNYISLNNNTASYLPQLIPTLTPICPSNLSIFMPVTSGVDQKQSSDKITATNAISSGASAIYHALNQVVLEPGFIAQSNSNVHIYIEGCSGNYAARMSNHQEAENESEPVINKIKIYPNPNNGLFMITLNQAEVRDLDVKMYDIIGKLVYQTKSDTNTFDVSVPDLPAGMYLVKLSSPSVDETLKFIKQ